jgi:hypothetical protein
MNEHVYFLSSGIQTLAEDFENYVFYSVSWLAIPRVATFMSDGVIEQGLWKI